MGLLIAGIIVHLVPGAIACRRARTEMCALGRITGPTLAAAVVAYVGLALVTFAGAWTSALPIHHDGWSVRWAGGVLVVVGATLYLAARVQFRTFRLAWGLDTGRLVTGGVYRCSRNPQLVGAVLLYAGLGLLGHSLAVVLLAGLLALTSLVWIPTEERILEERLGEPYARYRASTPRFLGLPWRSGAGPKAYKAP